MARSFLWFADSISTDRALDILRHSFQYGPYYLALTALVAAIAVAVLFRTWWRVGRDRWLGDQYAATGVGKERTKSLLSKETIVTEFTPPRLPGNARTLRQAEVALVLNENVRDLDVSATLIDLAVRKYLTIRELPRQSMLAKPDYELQKLHDVDEGTLPFEKELMEQLFKGSSAAVKLSSLRGSFSSQVATVRYKLYEQAMDEGIFYETPDTVRTNNALTGAGVIIAGVVAMALLMEFGAGLIAAPVIFAGAILIAAARAMPRRTALGHELYRQARGFRDYIAFAEIDRERFAEAANRFDEYLPYAIVFGCTKRWAHAFRDLSSWDPRVNWYYGTTGLPPLDAAIGIGEFLTDLAERRK